MRNLARHIVIWGWVALYAALVAAAVHLYFGNSLVTVLLTSIGAAWARFAVHMFEEQSS